VSAKAARVKDKWKLKKWYQVVAPQAFGSIVVGTTPADDPLKLVGRTIEVTLYDITGDLTQVHVHLYFQVIDVEGDKALTRFRGHELSRDYMRSLIRRKSSKVSCIVDLVTKDSYKIRVNAVALTSYRCKSSQKRAIRKVIYEHLSTEIPQMTFDEAVQAIVFGKISQELFEKAHKIYPLRKVEIYKSKLLMIPSESGGMKPAIVISPLFTKAH